jgi:hypothetical protein
VLRVIYMLCLTLDISLFLLCSEFSVCCIVLTVISSVCGNVCIVLLAIFCCKIMPGSDVMDLLHACKKHRHSFIITLIFSFKLLPLVVHNLIQ